MGFTTEFKKANATATRSAVKKLFPSIFTPGSNRAEIKTARVEIINRTMKFMGLKVSLIQNKIINIFL